jgi:uncharacterized protein
LFFFDTYALIEIATANPNFKNYLDFPYIVSALNIGEFYAYLIRTYGYEAAKKRIQSYTFEEVELTKELMIAVTEFKVIRSKKELSWPDCIGYMAAKQLKLRFLTGDKEFKGMENVEFVK